MKKTIATCIMLFLCLSSAWGQLDVSKYTALNRLPASVEHRDKSTNTLLYGGQVVMVRNLSIGVPATVSTPLDRSTRYLFAIQYFKEVLPPLGYAPAKEVLVDVANRKIIIYSEKLVPTTVTLNYKIGSAHISGGDMDDQNNMDGKVSATYQGVRIGEYYWTNSNFNHVEPKRRWWTMTVSGEETNVPMSQNLLNKYMDNLLLDKSKYQVNVNEFNKYYGQYYSRWSIDYMNKWSVTEEVNSGRTYPNSSFSEGNQWGLPAIVDFRQLAGMCPFNQYGSDKGHTSLNERDVRFALSPKLGQNPMTNYTIPGKCGATYWFAMNTNQYGFNMMPGGGRLNGNSFWDTNLCTTGSIRFWGVQGDIYGMFYTAKYAAKDGQFILHDLVDSWEEVSFHWMNVRWCRRLTDQELGYKLYVKVNNINLNGNEWNQLKAGNEIPLLKMIKTGAMNPNNISIVKKNINETIPTGYVELPKGYLRGFYVQHILDKPTPAVSVPTVATYASRVEDISLNVGYMKSAVRTSKTLAETEAEPMVIYPNPMQDMMNIKSSDPVVSVKIHSSSGKLVKNIYKPESTSINVADLSSGMYIAVVQTTKETATHKIIKR